MTAPTPADLFARPRTQGPEVVLTVHARQRCEEMGVPVRAVREILASPDRTYPGAPTGQGTPTLVAVSKAHPDWIVVHIPGFRRQPTMVVTVAFQTGHQPYRRMPDGTFELLDETTRELVAKWA